MDQADRSAGALVRDHARGGCPARHRPAHRERRHAFQWTVTVRLDEKAGGLVSLKLDGVEYAGNASGIYRTGVPVLERVEAGTRDAIFAPIEIELPDWHKSWDTKWKAVRDAGTLTGTRAIVDRGRAELGQTFALPNGDRVEVIYRLTAETSALEVIVVDRQEAAGGAARPLSSAIRCAQR